MYNRLVPEINGQRKFSAIQLRRITKMGINKEDPKSLTEEEIRKFVRLDMDPNRVVWNRGEQKTFSLCNNLQFSKNYFFHSFGHQRSLFATNHNWTVAH